MALQTSGAISMANIVAEFGGVGSDSISEYYVLAGMGVSGIPSSGSISFSHFHGKSKNVTTSVWTPSGYNSTSYVYWKDVFSYPNGAGTMYFYNSDNGGSWVYAKSDVVSGMNIQLNGTGTNRTYYSGIYRFTRGSYRGQSGGSGKYKWHNLTVARNTTVWIDTSGYVDTATIASIST